MKNLIMNPWIKLFATTLLAATAPFSIAFAGMSTEVQIEGRVKRFDQKWVWIEQGQNKTTRFPRSWFAPEVVFNAGKRIHTTIHFEPDADREPASASGGEK